jgi:hypothetical protein
MAKTAGTISFGVSDLTSEMTLSVKITGFRSWVVRLWVAKGLLKLAAIMIGSKLKIELLDPPSGHQE